MSYWTHIEGRIKTINPSIILDQIKIEVTQYKFSRTNRTREDISSPWFQGSEGCAKIIKNGEGLMIDGDLRDCSEEDFDQLIKDFKDIVKQCQGMGYLRVSSSDNIKQIEIYETIEITKIHSAWEKWYNRKW